MSHRNRSTIQHHKLFVQVYIDIKVIYFILPFLVHFVLKSELNVVTVDLHTVDEEQRNLIRTENLCSHHVVYQWL